MATAIWNEKEKRWTIRVWRDGKEKKFSCSTPGTKGKKIVIAKARKFKDEDILTSPTVENEWHKYLEDVTARSSSENYRNIECIGRLYILPKCGRKKLERMTLIDWQRVINDARKANGEALSKKSYSNIRAALTTFLNFCYRDRAIDYLPNGLYVPKNTNKVGKEILQPDQIKKLFDTKYDDMWYINYFRFLLLSGARPGEILGLKWNDIDGNIVHINRSLNGRGKLTDGKNKNAKRTFILSATMKTLLENQREKTNYLSCEWIFPSTIGSHSVQSTTLKKWRIIANDIGTKACLYSFRHTFVSLMKSSTISENLLKSIIGHSAAMDTFGTYGHEVDGEKESVATAIEETIRKII